MGDAAMERAATEDEILRMSDELRLSLRAGAAGLSTSKSLTHTGGRGRPVPSRLAEWSEFIALATVAAEEGRGYLEAAIGPGLSVKELGMLSELTGIAATFSGIITDMGGPGGHERFLSMVEEARAAGQRVVPQVSALPVTMEFGLRDPFVLQASAKVVRAAPLDDVFRDLANAVRYAAAGSYLPVARVPRGVPQHHIG